MSSVDDALQNVTAAQAVAGTLIAVIARAGSDLLEIDTDDFDPNTAAIINRISDNLVSKAAPALDELDQLITRAKQELTG